MELANLCSEVYNMPGEMADFNMKTKHRRKSLKKKATSPKEDDPLDPQGGNDSQALTYQELAIRQGELRKSNITRLFKSKLADNIGATQILEDSWYDRLVNSPPDRVDPATLDRLVVVSDKVEQYPSFFKVLFCSLDYSLVMMYALLFCILEEIWGEQGNSLLSLFIVYIVEQVLRALRQRLGEKNLVKKAFVDERFLC